MAFPAMHASVGIAIASITKSYPLCIILSIVSHFLVDFYPEHYKTTGQSIEQCKTIDDLYTYINSYSTGEKWMIGIEGLLCIGVIVALIVRGVPLFWIGAIGGNLIDIIEAINVKVLKREKIFCCHGGSFPVKISPYQGFGMRAIQTGILDTIFTVLLLMLSK
jgi:hypothetical protein